jgi:hypothetical protein
MKALSGSNLSGDVSFKVNFQPRMVDALPVGKSKFYALLIGIDVYEDPAITGLDNPIKDAQSFYNTITDHYTFDTANVRFLKNATMAQIVEALDYFAKIIRPQDNFLIL